MAAQETREDGAENRLFFLLGASRTGDKNLSPAAINQQEIELNFAVLNRNAFNPLELKEIQIPLLNGEIYTAEQLQKEEFIQAETDEFVWRGKISDKTRGKDWSGDVTFSFKNGAMSGLIYAPTGVYEIVPQANFRHVLIELDQSLLPPRGALRFKTGNNLSDRNPWLSEIINQPTKPFDLFDFNRFSSTDSASAISADDRLAPQGQCVAAPSGLTTWYRAENNADDAAGTHNATMNGGATYTVGKVGQAFSFSSANVGAVLTPEINLGTAYTIEFWVQPTGTNNSGYHTLLYRYNRHVDSNFTGIYYRNYDSTFQKYISFDDLAYSPHNSVLPDQWYHIAVTHNNVNNSSPRRIYINGTHVASEFGTIFANFRTGLRIGGQVFTPFNGKLDEISLYNRVLTQGEILDIVSAGGDGKCAGGSIPTVSINDVTVTEGNSGTTDANFNVTLSSGSTNSVTVNYATADVTATAGADYTATSGTLTFAPGETTKTISVPVIGDTIDESNETFKILLSNGANASINDGEGIGTITDDDDAPVQGATFNSSNDFSLVQGGASGVWRYGYTANDASNAVVLYTLTNSPTGCGSPSNAWIGATGGDQTPVIQRFDSPTGCLGTPPGSLHVHPGPSGQRTVLRWVAPAAGTYQLTGVLQRANPNATTDLRILKNETTSLFTGSIVSTYQQPFDFTVTVAANDTIDFSVGYGNSSYNSDGSTLNVTVGQPVTACQTAPANLQVFVPGENSSNDVQSGGIGTLVGNATYDAGKAGQALKFDGNGDYVRIEDSAAQKPANQLT
ncbi:MAG TPA: Calx-beta domain-containing protein, partial [Pyrinomonadaceae bacterium]|nr:Calx-beta domain-containing protein [Pyrinomonadaceae bacterium]